MKHLHASQLCTSLRKVKLTGIETADAYTIVTTIIACSDVVEKIQKMVQTTAEGLKGKEDADLQVEINKVVNPYLDQNMAVTAVSKATIDELLKQSDLKADDIAVIYQHMYNTKS